MPRLLRSLIVCAAAAFPLVGAAQAAATAPSEALPATLTGTVTYGVNSTESGISLNEQLVTTVTFALTSDDASSAVYVAQSGSHHWSESGTDGDCTSQGDATFDLQPGSGKIVIDKTRSNGSSFYYTWTSEPVGQPLPYTVTCPESGSQEVSLPPLPWWPANLPGGPEPSHFNPWTAPIHATLTGSVTGAAFFMSWSITPPLKKPCTSKASEITDVSTPNGQPTSLGDLKGSSFYPGQTISADQPVEFDLGDGSVIRLDKGSSLKIEDCESPGGVTPETPTKIKFELLLGAIWAKVTHVVGAENAYEIRTERVVAGNRGTIFWMTNTRTLTTLHVDSGSVWMQGRKSGRVYGKKWIVNAGQTATWKKGATKPVIRRGGRATPP